MLLPSAKEPSIQSSVRKTVRTLTIRTGGTTVISIETKAVVGQHGKTPSTIHGGITAYAKYTSAGLMFGKLGGRE